MIKTNLKVTNQMFKYSNDAETSVITNIYESFSYLRLTYMS